MFTEKISGFFRIAKTQQVLHILMLGLLVSIFAAILVHFKAGAQSAFEDMVGISVEQIDPGSGASGVTPETSQNPNHFTSQPLIGTLKKVTLGNGEEMEADVQDANNFSIAIDGPIKYIRLYNDRKFYPLLMTTTPASDGVIYVINGTDSVYMKEYRRNMSDVLPDFLDHVTKVYSSQHELYYTTNYKSGSELAAPYLNYDHETVIKLQDTNYACPVSSTNGKWILTMMGAAIIRMRPDKTEVSVGKMPSANREYSCRQMNQAAVSDDGQFAIDVDNQARIIQMTHACMRPLNDFQDLNGYDISKSNLADCPIKELNFTDSKTGDIYDDSNSARFTGFSSKGQKFYVKIFVHDINEGYTFVDNRKWTIRDASFDELYRSKLDYLALGDSFSSGEGDIWRKDGKSRYLAGTDVEANKKTGSLWEKCHVSPVSYPFLINGAAKSVACSGAVIDDIRPSGGMSHELPTNYLGQYGDGAPRLKTAKNRKDLQLTALASDVPGRIEQLRFVEKYHPKAITLTIGGNDSNFGPVMASCLQNGALALGITCHEALPEGVNLSARTIRSQFSRIVSLMKSIKNASPNTKIYLIGYPQFIGDQSDKHCLNGVLLNNSELKMIRELVTYFNQVSRAAATASGAYYLDIENSLGSHGICGLSLEKYVNGFVEALQYGRAEAFHPNSLGHKAMADSLKKQLGLNWVNGEPDCSTATNSCLKDDPSVQVPPLPDYAYIPGSAIDASAYAVRMVTGETAPPDIITKSVSSGVDIVKKGTNIVLDTAKHLFGSATMITVTLHSDPITLLESTSDSQGGFSGQITMPNSVKSGYHRLQITGETESGEPIDYYQYVYVYDDNDLKNRSSAGSQTTPRKPNTPAAGSSSTIPISVDIVTSYSSKSPESLKNKKPVALGVSSGDDSASSSQKSQSLSSASTANKPERITPTSLPPVKDSVTHKVEGKTRSHNFNQLIILLMMLLIAVMICSWWLFFEDMASKLRRRRSAMAPV